MTHSKWPGRDALQKATNGQFALHSQSVQMVVHAFLANIETTRQLRQAHPQMKMRYPYHPKRFYPVARTLTTSPIKVNKLISGASLARNEEQAVALGERLKQVIANPALDRGICHMDLTLDNVHRHGDSITVFDFDSAGECWRSIEPHGVLRSSKEYFVAWLDGYRSVRPFTRHDEKAVAAFSIIGDVRVVAWKLGVARSSRGKPILEISDLPGVVDKWLDWEHKDMSYRL